jgi:hypothetical protein
MVFIPGLISKEIPLIRISPFGAIIGTSSKIIKFYSITLMVPLLICLIFSVTSF